MSLSGPQRLCIALIVVGFVTSLVGIVSPYWEYYSVNGNGTEKEFRIGLLLGCYTSRATNATTSTTTCEVIDWDNPGQDVQYYQAVRLLAVISVLLYLSSTVLAVLTCFSCRKITSIVYFSILAVLGGITGVASVATFAVFSEGDTDFIDELIEPDVHLRKGWAFYLSTSGSCFVLLLGILSMNVPKKRTMYLFTATNEGSISFSHSTSNSGYGRIK